MGDVVPLVPQRLKNQKFDPTRPPWWPYDRPMNAEERARFLAFGQGSGFDGDGGTVSPEEIQKRLDTWGLGDEYDPERNAPA